ncbi:septin-5 isoform X1 [Pongo abelii]|nr:septin-5 isoform X1 [Pongo abelii]
MHTHAHTCTYAHTQALHTPAQTRTHKHAHTQTRTHARGRSAPSRAGEGCRARRVCGHLGRRDAAGRFSGKSARRRRALNWAGTRAVARGSRERPPAPSGGRKPRSTSWGRDARRLPTPGPPQPACRTQSSPPAVLEPGLRPRGPGRAPGPRDPWPVLASAQPCLPQPLSGGSARGPISRRPFPGDGGRGRLCRPPPRAPRAPATPRLWLGCGSGACPGCDAATARGQFAQSGGWLGRPRGSTIPQDIDKQYVGFATLPNQVHRKSVKKGFDFTLMVAGESGLGKSTLVHSLFLTDLYKDRKLLSAEERISQTVEILKHTVDIEEKGVKLKLTIVDTPGFGDAVNNTECWKPITDYVDQQFEQYFRDESGLNRKNIQDNRVHCCLYFISPFGHGLRPVDVGFMKALHEKVNIVPLIAKADCLVPSEIRKLKERIREEIDKFGIHVYQFPECDSDEDEDFKQQDRELKESAPFAVIGSNTVVEAKGQRVRGRLYPWGIVEVENQAHCDFVKLRNMLIRTHMHDLKDVTCDVHYENYRAHCIQQMTSKLTQDSRMESPIPILPLPTPDAETEKLIRMKDEELRRMQEMLQRMKQQMQDQ